MDGIGMSKYMLIVLNFLSLLLGLGILITGIYSTSMGSEISHLVSLQIPYTVLILGLLMIMASILGMYATMTESVNMLKGYFVVVGILLVVQVLLSAVALARRHDVDLMLYDAWGRAFLRDPGLLEKIEKTVCPPPFSQPLSLFLSLQLSFIVRMLWVCNGG